MFTESVRIDSSFLACLGGSAKYQRCLKFHQSLPTLDPGCGSAHLDTLLSCLSMFCQSHFQICPILSLSSHKTLDSTTRPDRPYLKGNQPVINN